MWLFAVFLAVPLIEISLFVVIGGWIGLWATLAVVLGTGVAGVALLRWQGRQVAANVAMGIGARQSPLTPVAQGALLSLAAILLILPGFLTDTLGLLLLIPQVRSLITTLVAGQVAAKAMSFGMNAARGRGRAPDPEVIDAEAIDVTPADPNANPSGWTRH